MELTKDTIEKIEELVEKKQTVRVEIDGLTYTGHSLKPVLFEPQPAPLEVSTLSGLADYIKANLDSLDLVPTRVAVIVDSYRCVSLVSNFEGPSKKRTTYIAARVDEALKVYPFEKYQEVEPFVIALRAMFEPTEDLERVIKYVSKVKGGTSFSLEDDGISQTASVMTGASGALTGKETAPAIVRLKPFRTFRDIEQPESEFLLRMKLVDTESKVVGCALFEADGGRWRNQALLSIKEHLTAALPEGMTIIA
jgi:hypothetical protein